MRELCDRAAAALTPGSSRGAIYDANMNALAVSATVDNATSAQRK